MPFSFDVEAYLVRVGLSDLPAPDDNGLRSLHDAQFSTIPFENFDIQLGRGINLDPAHLVAKLVGGRRGGYCFELNGLMLMVLRSLGFTARPLLARVHLGAQPSGRTHQLTLVELDNRSWLIDVGFGSGGLRCPLPLDTERTETGADWAFRLREQDPWGVMMQSQENGEWKDSYSFDLSHVTAADIALGNHFTSTSSTTHFVNNRIASLPLVAGRVSLLDDTLTRIAGGEKTTRQIAPGPAYLAELAKTFGIVLDAEFGDLRDLPTRDEASRPSGS